VAYSTSSDNPPPTPPTPTGTPNACAGQGLSYSVVGMQSLVNIIRGTGANNVIQIPGMGYANFLSCGTSTSPVSCGFLDSTDGIRISDPHSPAQLMADVDVYPDGNVCGNTSCYDTMYKPVAQVMPLEAGETGPGNTTTAVDQFMNWIDQNANGYYAWAWDTWAGLISSYSSATPANPWGVDYYDHINNITPPPPPQPTDGITFAQYVTAPCNVGLTNGHITLPSAVNTGDDLIAVFAGQGYFAPAEQVDSVSDNINGAWTKLADTGSQSGNSGGNTLDLSYSVFQLQNSKAAPTGLTLTINGATNGNSGLPSAAVYDVRGASSITSTAFNTTLQDGGPPYTGPTLTNVAAGDVVLGLWGSYSGNGIQDFSSTTTPWNTNNAYWISGQNCTATGMDWTQPTTTGPIQTKIGSNFSDVYYGGGIDLHP
jgi:hypothetical protein